MRHLSTPVIRKNLVLAALLSIFGAVLVGLTVQIDESTPLSGLEPHTHRLMAVEVAFFGVLILEIIGRAVIQQYRSHRAAQLGLAVRGMLRVVGYLIIGVTIVSILAQNPSLAIGVGGVTGVVIAFSAQNLIGNVFAGMFLAVGRPFNLNDDITALGATGRVIDIGLMHTLLDAGDKWVLIPNSAALTTALQKKKQGDGTLADPHDSANC